LHRNEPIIAAANPLSFPFGKSKLSGSDLQKPTSLQFGPDGRLYVALMDGLIKVFEIERTNSNNYKVVNSETIHQIKNIQNHNDNGTVANYLNNRLVTGLFVTGTANQPVIYVHSSDPRIGGGPSGSTTNLDTNSGILSRLTRSGNSWQKLDLVRGLPRSEENHHTNGITANASGTKLYLAAGGNTNMGGVSNNFAFLPEYALSAAILEIDLLQIGNSTYDLPTLDDEDRNGVNDFNDPFGGNRGKNQAKLVAGGPVQIYSPGFRNPYDVVLMQNGRMYSWDNGPNSGWGGPPINNGTQGNCTNGVSEPGQTQHDALHLITGKGYYAGHANPTRGNDNNTFNSSNPQSPVPYSNPVECDYRGPGQNGNGVDPQNDMLVSLPTSTNGIAEYKASNFGGLMQGNLLAASFNNKIYRVAFDQNGQSIVVFEPEDFGGGGTSGCVAGNAGQDADLDGYSDADELANSTDPCSAADTPTDADGDSISDLTDQDDDNDGIYDTHDPFAIDPTNGAGTSLGVDHQWENDGADPGFIANLGFSGLMFNGIDNYRDQFDLNQMTISGAAGVVTVDNVTSGDPIAGKNNQDYAFQFGVNVNASSPVFRAHTRVLAPFSGISPKNWQSMGLFIGTGDQDNYLKLVINSGGLQFASEVDGSRTYEQNTSADVLNADYVDLYIEVDPASALATALYQVTKNGQTSALIPADAATTFPGTWLSNPTKLAVGIISTSIGAQPFPATWDFISVKPVDDGPVTNSAPVIAVAGEIHATTNVPVNLSATVTDDGLPNDSINSSWLAPGGYNVNISDTSNPSSSASFSEAGSYTLSITADDGELSTTETVTVIVSDQGAVSAPVYRINAGGPSVPASDGDWIADTGSFVNTGKKWFSNSKVDTSNIDPSIPEALFESERYDSPGGSDMHWQLPVVPGTYDVNLYFAETYFGVQSPGGRVFTVEIEDQSLDGFDIFSNAGGYTALVKSFTVTSDDTLDIKFSHIAQNPAIKAIEVLTHQSGGNNTSVTITDNNFSTDTGVIDLVSEPPPEAETETEAEAETETEAEAEAETEAVTESESVAESEIEAEKETQIASGLLTVEVESYNSKVSSGAHRWESASKSGASGSAMVSTPDTGKLNNNPDASAVMNYSMYFAEAGTYHVWLRGWGDTVGKEGKSDSVHVGINNNHNNAQVLENFPDRWTWSNKKRGSGTVTVTVPAPGEHVISLWMREDGLILDQLILTKDASFTPIDGAVVLLNASAPASGSSDSDDVAEPELQTDTEQQPETATATATDLQSDGGTLSIEVENFASRSSDGAHQWLVVSESGASGSAVVSTPNTGKLKGSPGGSAAMNYPIPFTEAGTYTVWLRGLGDSNGSGKNDSVHVGINNNLSTSQVLENFPDRWTWSKQKRSGGSVTITIPSAGVHVINLWMREDGLILDKMVLTKNSSFIPTSIGPDATTDVSDSSSSATQDTPSSQHTQDAIVRLSDDFIAVRIEAEDFTDKNDRWMLTSPTSIPNVAADPDEPHNSTASGKANLELLPDTRVTHNDPVSGGPDGSLWGNAGPGPSIDYLVNVPEAGRYLVYVKTYSTGLEDNGIHVGINGTTPDSGERIQTCAKRRWVWTAAQRTSAEHCGERKKIWVDVPAAGPNKITFYAREDGFELDQFVLLKETHDGSLDCDLTLGDDVVCKNINTGKTVSDTELPISKTVGSNDDSSAANSAGEQNFGSRWNFQNSADGSTVQQRHEAAGVNFNGKLYVLGGRGARGVSVYDPGTNRWSQKAAQQQNLGDWCIHRFVSR